MTKCYWDYVYKIKKVYDNEGRKWYEVIKK